MRLQRIVVLAASIVVLGAPSTASEEHAAAFCTSIMEGASLARTDCAQPQPGAGLGTIFVCARASTEFDGFEQTLDSIVTKSQGLVVPPRALTDWQTESGGKIRWYQTGEKWVVVTFDSASKQVVMSYSKDRDGILPVGRGVDAPTRIAVPASEAEVRQQARVGVKSGAKGIVVLSAVIRKDGSVDDVEILGCLPRNRGLEDAATNALRKWRYEPAKKEGAPVDVSMVATFTYGPGGTFRAQESADYVRPNASPGVGQPSRLGAN